MLIKLSPTLRQISIYKKINDISTSQNGLNWDENKRQKEKKKIMDVIK